MERCDQELLGSYSEQVAREIAFRRNDEFEFSHAPSYHEFQRMLTDWVGLIELPKMKRLEVEKLFSALVIIEKTRKTLAEVIKYRLDANNEGPEEDIGTGCTISELALDVGLGLHDNWGMTLIGARQTNLMERMDSLLRANGFSLQENSSFDSAGDARYYKSDIKTIIATDNMQTRAEALLQMQHDDYSPSHTARISLHGSPVMNARSILHVTKILEREGGIGVCLGEGGKDPRWPKLVHEFMPTTKV